MRAVYRWSTFALAVVLSSAGGAARAQQATPQYYGYAQGQAGMPSGQAGYACQPGTACQPEKYGCNVTVCPCPCTTANACNYINSMIPPIHTPPTCYEQNVCTIINEGPPPTPRDVTIFRNCYVPIKVVTQPGPNNVTPVNINVKWREVHVLCGPDGAPLSSQQASAVLQQLNEQVASAPPAAPTAPTAAAPTAPVAVTPSMPVAPQPAAPVAAAAVGPQKQWVWLTEERIYGFGYQRADGYWIIDPNSKRPTLPEGQSAVNVPNPASNPSTITASTR